MKSPFEGKPSSEWLEITRTKRKKVSQAVVPPDESTIHDHLLSTKNESFSIHPEGMKKRIEIGYDLSKAGTISIEIYDITGSKVFGVREHKSAGHHMHNLPTCFLNAGIYFLKFEAGDVVEVEKIVFLR